MNTGKLIFFCGKMGAGKSTQARSIARERRAVLLSEDEWLESIYPNEIRSLEDYIQCSRKLRPQIKKLVQSILSTGTDVVMDFPANTTSQRAWFREIFIEVNASHIMLFVDVPDDKCLQQIAKRSIEQPERAATDTEAMFRAVTKHFTAPIAEEGFNVIRVTSG